MRGATQPVDSLFGLADNFNSHAPCGARLVVVAGNLLDNAFQLTRPMRGATRLTTTASKAKVISTHTPHAGRDRRINALTIVDDISTHTPHAGRDPQQRDTPV